LLVAGLVVGVQLAGEIGCPAVPAVEARLAALLPASTSASPHAATLTRTDGGIALELRRADGTPIGRRTIAPGATCAATADSIAVVIAAWEAQVRGEPGPRVALPPPRLASAAPIAVESAHPPPPKLAWEIDAAALGSITSGAFAAGASASVLFGRHGFPLAFRLGFAGTDTRQLALGSGRVAYTRLAVVATPTLTVLARWVRLELHADLAAAALMLRGEGFLSNGSDSPLDVALGGGLRASIERWSVTPWLDVTLLGWLLDHTASAQDAGASVSTEIPHFDVWLRVGVAYGRR
jgi:hypothetical protein